MRERRALHEMEGTVVTDRMDKTVVVQVTRLVRHHLLPKVLKRTKRFMAHDEKNECTVGDKVCIRQSRPLSRNKHWRVIRILEKAK